MQELFFFVIGAFVELFTVMIFFLVAMYSKKETGNLLRTYDALSVMVRQLYSFTEQHTEIGHVSRLMQIPPYFLPGNLIRSLIQPKM